MLRIGPGAVPAARERDQRAQNLQQRADRQHPIGFPAKPGPQHGPRDQRDGPHLDAILAQYAPGLRCLAEGRRHGDSKPETAAPPQGQPVKQQGDQQDDNEHRDRIGAHDFTDSISDGHRPFAHAHSASM